MRVETEVPQAEVDASWSTEFRRRIDEVKSGQAKLLTADDVDRLLTKFRG